MLEDALLDLTERGDIVLDPFLGSENAVLMETGETRQELAARRAGAASTENRSSHKD
jgi:predicted amidohydrolase